MLADASELGNRDARNYQLGINLRILFFPYHSHMAPTIFERPMTQMNAHNTNAIGLMHGHPSLRLLLLASYLLGLTSYLLIGSRNVP